MALTSTGSLEERSTISSLRTTRLSHSTLAEIVLLIMACLFLSVNQVRAETPTDSLVRISLKDGNDLLGEITHRGDTILTVATPGGLEVRVPESSIISIEPIRGRLKGGVFQRFDPNYSRLMFAPTGRTLRKGQGYFSDHYLFFPGITYGFTDQLSLMAGISVLPGGGLSDQLIYLAPRVGIKASDNFALSVGALYVSVADIAAGIAFGTATIGPPDRNFTAGIGLGYAKEEGEKLNFANHPIIMLGGNIRISNGIALVSENWLFTGDGFEMGQQAFGLALRFFGDNFSTDVGVILIGEVLSEGFPIPWLSFTYNFGR
ncbi:hypothetical protein ACFL5K_03360 [Gemmatimonadota bacterium]